MTTEFSEGGLTMRVDRDVFEVLVPRDTHRIPLDKLQVRLTPGKSQSTLVIGQCTVVGADGQPLPLGPLYSVADKDSWMIRGARVIIRSELEPSYRQFFAGLAPLCGDRQVQEPPVQAAKRGLFSRRGE